MAQTKQNVQLQLPDPPLSAGPEVLQWWRQVKFALEQVIPSLISNVNEHVDGRFVRLRMELLSSEPVEIQNGDVVFADGSNFNPGSGAGLYERKAGAWVKL